MSGLKGQDRTPRAPVRERRNSDNLFSVVEFIDPNEPIQIGDEGTFVLQLSATGGLQTVSAELGIKLDANMGLVLSGDGLAVSIGPGIEFNAGDVAVDLLTDGGLAFTGNELGLDFDEFYRRVLTWGGLL